MNLLKTKRFNQGIQIIFLAVIFLEASSLNAWTGPTATAPASNTEAPLNVSSQIQTKYGNLYFPKWYDSNNAGYYIDPAQNSVFARIYANLDIRAPKFYDSDNTGYYVDPNSTSIFNYINLGGVSRNTWPESGSTAAAEVCTTRSSTKYSNGGWVMDHQIDCDTPAERRWGGCAISGSPNRYYWSLTKSYLNPWHGWWCEMGDNYTSIHSSGVQLRAYITCCK